MKKNYYQLNKEKEARKLLDLADIKPNKKEYVLINEDERVTDIDDLDEKIYELLKEDIEKAIKVYPTTENILGLDAEYIVESLSDDDLICEDTYVPQEDIKKLQDLLDKWCLRTQKSVSMTFEVDYKKEINIAERIEKIKKQLIEE